jgi:hypothetical protein
MKVVGCRKGNMLMANGVTGCGPKHWENKKYLLAYEPSMARQLWRKLQIAEAN